MYKIDSSKFEQEFHLLKMKLWCTTTIWMCRKLWYTSRNTYEKAVKNWLASERIIKAMAFHWANVSNFLSEEDFTHLFW